MVVGVQDMEKIDFERVYKGLNEKQCQAVKKLDGPTMVLAGPGTGKTQILSRRVANILTQEKTKPSHILCLTFTEAGATEMQDRLEKLIGQAAREVRVSTLHSFCNELILNYPEVFETEASPRLLTEPITYKLLKSAMDEYIKEGNVLYKESGDRYSYKDQLLNLYSKMKQEELNAQDIREQVGNYFNAINDSEKGTELYSNFKYSKKSGENKPGDFKPEYFKVREQQEKLLSGASVVDAFKKKIKVEHYFDYDDMILWVKAALETNKEFQEEISSSISYLFVDEFQDTSTVQYGLIKLLMRGKTQPNIFVVGDDDQRIYGFQGATADNFEAFRKDFAQFTVQEITLDLNYRSPQVVLNAAKSLMGDKGKNLYSQIKYNHFHKKPQLCHYQSKSEEMSALVQRVQQLLDDGVEPQEIGVIYGRNAYGESLAQLFKAENIPVQVKEKSNLLTDPFFVKLLDILAYLSREHSETSHLRKILFYDFFDVSESELVELRDVKRIANNEKIQKYDSQLNELRKRIRSCSALASLRLIIKELGIDSYLVNSTNNYHLAAVLSDMMQLMSDLGEYLSLEEFLNHVKSFKEMKVELPINNLETKANCVQLMTAHGSKGREFDYVFMLNCGTNWPGRENTNTNFSYPPSMKSAKDMEENRRLFYVAMTRAKKELNLSYYISDKNVRTTYIDDLGDSIEDRGLQEATILSHGDVDVVLPKLSKTLIEQLMSSENKFRLSVSTLNAFLQCPLSFYLNKGLKLPFEGNESTLFGSLMHETLEGLYLSEEKDGQKLVFRSPLSKEAAIELFEKLLDEKSDELLTDHLRQVLEMRGKKILENFYKQGYLKTDTDVKIALEKKIELNLPVAGLEIPIKGIIDKVEVSKHTVTLIDYKTGNPQNAERKLEASSQANPIGGDYWRQAVFYYILWTNSPDYSSEQTIEVKYILLEDDKKTEVNTHFSQEKLEEGKTIVLEQLVNTYKAIKVGDFNCGCGQLETDRNNGQYPCSNCSFVMLNSPLDNKTAELIEQSRYNYVRQNLRLSVSELNRFMTCSNALYFDKILPLTPLLNLVIGHEQSVAAEDDVKAIGGPVFGSLMHHVLEEIYKQEKIEQKGVHHIFDTVFDSYRYEFANHEQDVSNYAYTLLDNLVDTYFPSSCKVVDTEKKFKVTIDGNYQLEGILDKIEYDKDFVRIVDYKTGSAKHAKEALQRGGHYWRQAVFYNILLEESGELDLSNKRVDTHYILLDDNSSEQGYSVETIQLELADIELVKKQIKLFFETLEKMEFRDGCHLENCDYCRLIPRQLR